MKYKTLSAVLIALIVALTGCNEDPTYYKLEDQPDHMHLKAVSYTHLTLPTTAAVCRSRWSPYH